MSKKTKTTKSRRGTALVTGGAGFIGSQLAKRLVSEGWKVVVIDNLSFGKREYVPSEAVFYEMDIQDPGIHDVFVAEAPEVVFHLAAQIDVRVSVEHPIRDAEINIHGSLRVLEACVKNKVERIVFSSSGGAMYHKAPKYPTPETVEANPVSPYGVAKRAFELYLFAARHVYGLDSVVLRYANVYGPYQDLKGEAGVIGIFTSKLIAGESVTIYGDGKNTRDFVYVDDVVEANLKAVKAKPDIYNIGTGVETNVNRVERLVRQAAGAPGKPKYAADRRGEERRSCLDARRAGKALKWKSKVKIEDGIRRTVEWFRRKS
jgi:UDP-glucose 4-epimerase